MTKNRFSRAESDYFVGKRGRLERFLICSTQGFFPVLARIGKQALRRQRTGRHPRLLSLSD